MKWQKGSEATDGLAILPSGLCRGHNYTPVVPCFSSLGVLYYSAYLLELASRKLCVCSG
jgi:hypothetical protein